MVLRMFDGTLRIINPYECAALFFDSCKEWKDRKRKAFEEGTFQVHKDGREFYKLEIDGRFAGCWCKGNLNDANIVIETAFNVWEIAKGRNG